MPPRRPMDVSQNFTGVNQSEDQQSINIKELWRAQNLYPKHYGVAEMRPGSVRYTTYPWPGVTRARAMNRFYPGSGAAKLITAWNSGSGDVLTSVNDASVGSGTSAELSQITPSDYRISYTANKQWTFARYAGKLFMGNAVQTIQATADGLTSDSIGDSTDMSIGYPAGPYRYRLLTYGNPTYPYRLYYTAIGGEANASVAGSGIGYRTVESHESITAASVFGRDEDRGIFGDLAVFTGTSIWVQRDDFWDEENDTYLGTWDQMTEHYGTLSPHTIVNTPYGLLGLGYDSTTDFVVFIIPFGQAKPLIISNPIREMEALPMAYRQYACAEYYKGFYIVSFVPQNGTTPTKQWWCDLRRFSTDYRARNYGVGWWGPMVGQCIGAYAIQEDVPDANEFFGADGNGGYINRLWQESTYSDNGTDWTAIFETRSMDSRDPISMKTFHAMMVGVRTNSAENLDVTLNCNEGETSKTDIISVGSAGTVVGDTTLVGDSTLVGGDATSSEALLSGDGPLFGNRLSVTCEYTGGNYIAFTRAVPLGTKTERVIP